MHAQPKEITPEKLAAILRRHRRLVALTATGISAQSGIPDFRSKGGLWERFDPMEYAHSGPLGITRPRSGPCSRKWTRSSTPPGPTRPITPWRSWKPRDCCWGIITQNVDNLHQAAGSQRVVEFHGNAHPFHL